MEMLNKKFLDAGKPLEDCRVQFGVIDQSIRERLLRLACRYCDFYATDILILLEGETLKGLLEGTHAEIDIYFRQSGVNWLHDADEPKWDEIPAHYRRCAKLMYAGKDICGERTYSLYEGYGNC